MKRRRDGLSSDMSPRNISSSSTKVEEENEEDLMALLDRQQSNENNRMFEQQQREQEEEKQQDTQSASTTHKGTHWGDVQNMEMMRTERANSNGSNYGDVDDVEIVETKRSIHPEELQLNRSFASYDWLNGVLWDNESIPIELERKLHALVVDENDGSIILDRFLSEPQTRSRYGRRDEKENESNRKSSKNRFGNKSRVARIIFENKQNNAWPADKLVDEFYASELSAKQLARFHRPVWQFTKEEKGKKMIIKLWNKNKNAEAFGKNEETVGSTNNAMRKSSDLSLRSGNFIMVEHMERFPMCLPNFGMVSRLVQA